ncbi:hypothetical protein HanXRQr2_Chr13g0611461 [Helianthus annuus]|uniref:Uncharacterized protein n=1 Tax=Helianthus annuus TaxID=4232 RepID=A0A251SX80_HELAN|nr:hypothetical protein HanXRQr2_Chr13g0611461 [Helianthus annuus]
MNPVFVCTHRITRTPSTTEGRASGEPRRRRSVLVDDPQTPQSQDLMLQPANILQQGAKS